MADLKVNMTSFSYIFSIRMETHDQVLQAACPEYCNDFRDSTGSQIR